MAETELIPVVGSRSPADFDDLFDELVAARGTQDSVNARLTADESAITGKQATLTEQQLTAVNSGIDSTKVAAIASNTSAIAGKQDALTTAQLAAVNSGVTSATVSAVAGKQDALSSAQLAAANSGINADKVAQIATNTTAITGKADKTTTDSLQSQINAITSQATQDSEVQQARVGIDGKEYDTLKTRIDTEGSFMEGQVDIVNGILQNPIMEKKTVTHPAGWSPKTRIFDGLNLKSGVAYAINITSETTLPSTYLYFCQSNGTEISNRSLNGKTKDKWVITPAQDYTNASIRIASGSSVTVTATLGLNKDGNVIEDMKKNGDFRVAKFVEARAGVRALISIIDDDGKSEFYEIYKPLIQAGYKITCAIDPVNWTGVGDSFMPWSQVEELRDLGCEFVVHGAYPWIFPKSSQSEGYASGDALRAYFKAAQDAMKEHSLSGFGIGVYPQSAQNHDTRTVVKDYFKCVFGGPAPTGEAIYNTSPITSFRIYRMAGIGHSDGSEEADLQTFKDAIDATLAAKGWLVILNHSQYGWDSSKVQKLKDILDYAAAQGVQNVHTEKGFDIFKNALELGDFANKTTNEDRPATIVGADGSVYAFPTALNGKTFVFNQDGTVSWI